MSGRTLEQWLLFQESLNPGTIVMGLERVREVAGRLALQPPKGAVFTVAGTNGKGSAGRLLEQLLRMDGLSTGVYASPHLCRYHERIRINGEEIGEQALLAAFAAVEAARGEAALTYFEFGTLAAMAAFSAAGCTAWVLEVGMGGRLDAVNIIDPDYSLITTIALDHQQWLGATIEEIAGEKAGILRAGGRGYFGDRPLPESIRQRAASLCTPLACLGEAFDWQRAGELLSWHYAGRELSHLPVPAHWSDVQCNNAALVLAAIADFRPQLLNEPERLAVALAAATLPGRLQRISRRHEWVLDVAHNPQAGAALRAQLARLPAAADTTVVLGMLADKDSAGFIHSLGPLARRWIVCTADDPRALPADALRTLLAAAGFGPVEEAADCAAAMQLAQQLTAPGGRIIVCGSFRVVGPALNWLALN